MAFIRLTFVPLNGGGGGGGIPFSAYTAKGAILVGTAPSTPAALPVGADNYVLLADSTQPTGVRWGDPPPPFAIASFTKSAASLVRRGQGVGASSTAAIAYTSGPPTSAALSNVNTGTVGGGLAPAAWTGLVGPNFAGATQPNNVAYDGADGQPDPVWTINLSATKPPTKTASLTVQWTRDVYFGVGAAGLNTTQIQSLTDALATSRNRTFSVSPAGQKVYYAYPADYGLAHITSGGVDADFALTVASLTNTLTGLVSLYNVYESTFLLTGPFTFVVT